MVLRCLYLGWKWEQSECSVLVWEIVEVSECEEGWEEGYAFIGWEE